MLDMISSSLQFGLIFVKKTKIVKVPLILSLDIMFLFNYVCSLLQMER